MGVIRWEVPPPDGRKRNGTRVASQDWDAVAADLRANPGRWALIVEDAKAPGYTVNARTALNRRGLDVFTTSRVTPNGVNVYAYYVPSYTPGRKDETRACT